MMMPTITMMLRVPPDMVVMKLASESIIIISDNEEQHAVEKGGVEVEVETKKHHPP